MSGGEFRHLSVMPKEVLAYLAPKAGEIYLDGTVGGGGHARLILEASAPDGRLIGLDRDPAALKKAGEVLAPFGDRAVLRHGNFSEASQILQSLGVERVDGILLDLGVSSHQLDAVERGFSFRADAPLDMRMDTTSGQTAADVLASASAEELTRIFREYGEERWAGRIARRIVALRPDKPLLTTEQLADLVRDTVPGGHKPARIHPATRVFQALRIHVNGELDHVAQGISRGLELLKTGGRMVVISFHSLEDRIVKQFFQRQAQRCICPPQLPYCSCGHEARLEILTRKAVRAGEEEVADNPRARSAVLRAARRLD
ncbi:16S rRNA (cytosine(1402)-N(4))-methyltransferase RsmH [Desulfuromonas sp. AOP6]|uniref:16S rRNA (cytosine(1402)-N(4))-methyltransferase RsmH n=1 Tax=Desulfuromonas sp. AOP6 TaxID=1566351 RepID=UPI0012725C7A|nr:16S rRNA (cytosine(1402)-N(4))-methyltransferase RsmH [Desulfuromonas sp. AOP6]BCA80534.1 ribosomal RNA small subunit methyltransferase H [Desulfuromonas sp. AOP6]